jgi:hypothetical protein
MIVFGGFNLSNWVFGAIRNKNQQHPQQQHEFYPPATPQRHPSGGFIDQHGFYTPYQTPYGTMNGHMLQQAAQSMPALPSTEGGAPEEKKSPTKKRLFA